jgi:hypothetical protein
MREVEWIEGLPSPRGERTRRTSVGRQTEWRVLSIEFNPPRRFLMTYDHPSRMKTTTGRPESPRATANCPRARFEEQRGE